MKNNGIAYFVILLLMLLVSLSLNIRHYYVGMGEPGTKEGDTIRMIYWDSIPVFYPVAKDSTVLHYVTVRLPADSSAAEGPKDSINANIPITQKIYSSSDYTAYVSGFRPSLDSLNIYRKNTVVQIPPPVSKEKPWKLALGTELRIFNDGNSTIAAPSLDIRLAYEKKWWGAEAMAGYQYVPGIEGNERSFRPFVGARAYFKLLRF